MKRTVLLLLLLIPAFVFLSAGDLATLENLGFSSDGKYFMFGQHVLETDKAMAYAEIGIVDVPENVYVPGGWKKQGWEVNISPSLLSRGALYELLEDSVALKKKYGISHIEQGRLLYTRSNSDEIESAGDNVNDEGTPVLIFRDFERGRTFSLALIQEQKESPGKVSASFYITINVKNSSGKESEYKTGRPGYFRDNVSSYRIDRVWCGPDGDSIVIAVAKEYSDMSVRYMVETIRL